MKKKLLKGSISAKLIIIFLLANVFLCSIYLYFYASSMKLLKNERLLAADKANQSYLQSLDRQITNVKRAIYNSYATQDWSELATYNGEVDDYQILQQVLIAQERIGTIVATSEIVEDVSVHFPKWGRTISTQDGLKRFDKEEWNNIKMPVDSVGAQIVYYEEEAFLTSKYQLPNPELFSITAKICYDKFHNNFSNNEFGFTTIASFLFDVQTKETLLNKTNGIINTDLLLEQIKKLDFMEDIYPTIKFNGNKYIIISNTSSYSGIRNVNVIKLHELIEPFTWQTKVVVIFMIVISSIMLLMFVYINRSIVNPINKMVQALKLLETGDFSVRLATYSKDEFSTLFTSFNYMVENLKSLVSEVYEKELLVEKANFKQLQSQINPHFLYNSFYALSTMIKIGDEENAIAFCTHLATYYQYITHNGADSVPLSEELKHAQNYLNIMCMRNSNIEVIFPKEWDEKFTDLYVPRLIVQPLIENAFEHGSKTVMGKFKLKLTITEAEEKIFISVEDNGTCRDETVVLLQAKMQEHQPIKDTVGLLNIHKRLKIFFGSNSGIVVSKSPLGGLKVVVCIDVKGGAKNDF